jgi:hypothetical protein
MEKTIDQLKLEAERERAERYLERFGMIPEAKEVKPLKDLNN